MTLILNQSSDSLKKTYQVNYEICTIIWFYDNDMLYCFTHFENVKE